MLDVEVDLGPAVFFATIRVRELMFRANRFVSGAVLARYLKIDRADLVSNLDTLVLAGLAESGVRGYRLTDDGAASVRWSAPPPPDGVITPRWVTELARAIAEHYAVTVSDMLRAEIGQAVVARSRLCFALYARGWSFERIEEHFALASGWARRAVERWKRLRDQAIPKTGPELRAWRERLGLSQTQASRRLGVSLSTIKRAERGGFASRFMRAAAAGRA